MKQAGSLIKELKRPNIRNDGFSEISVADVVNEKNT